MFTQDFETVAISQLAAASSKKSAPSPYTSQPATPAPSRPASRVSHHKTSNRLSAMIDRLLHPTDSKPSPTVNVAVPKQPSDGLAHFAPGGGARGGLL